MSQISTYSWTAKEAAFKAMSEYSYSLFPHRKLTWHDAYLSKSPVTGRPSMNYSAQIIDTWKQALNSTPTLHVSITHDGEYVTSFVVAEQESNPTGAR